MFAAWYANAWGLTTLMETITEIELCNPELEGKIKMGTLGTTISKNVSYLYREG